MKQINTAKTAVFEILKAELTKNYIFHNYALVLYALDAVNLLVAEERIKDKDQILYINLAACFYISGYAKDKVYGGGASIQYAQEFMQENAYDEEAIIAVKRLIAVTNSNVVPITKTEQVVQDGVHGFMADKSFLENQDLWRKEYEAITDKKISSNDWFVYLQSFADAKLFYTSYAVKNWQYKLRSNLEKLISKEKRQVNKQVEKGRDTVFRITLRNHISLSDNADRKAHILLSVNAIIISIVFSRIFPKLDNPSNAFLYVPTLVFVVFTVISIILSVIATRPRVTKGKFSYDDIMHKKTNILFFGNFHRVKLEEYERAMDVLLSNDEYIYNSLTKDLYYLGKVVAKKYRILQYTYAVFMVGIVISTIMYVVYFNMYN